MPTILTKKSDTPGSIPATANLTNAAGGAELAVNTADKRLFTITSGSQVVELGTNPSSITCADGSFTVARIGSGTVTQLTSTSATITTLTATSATVTNLTATSIVISNLSIASANITTLTSSSATISTTLALSGGTANGVLYLNGSKVATSGSALTFTGTNFGVTNAGNIEFTLTGSAGVPQFSLVNGAGTQYIQGGLGGSNNMVFGIGNTEQMRLTSTGLGIGTSSPTHKLQTNGSGRFGTMTTGPGLLSGSSDTFQVGLNQDNTNTTNTQVWAEYVNGATSASWAVRYRAANDTGTASTRLFLDAASGNLGIGTSSPAARLDVVTGTARWNISNDGSGNIVEQFLDSTGAAYRNLNSYALNHILYTSGSERMRLDSSGNLGIGTSSPEERLHVVGASNTSTTVQISSANTGYAPILNFDGVVGAAADNLLGLVNASWDTHTNVVSSIRFESGADTTNKDDGLISFWTSASGPTLQERMRLDSSGNLGLGVTPSAWGTGYQSVFETKNVGAIAAAGPYISVLANTYYNSSNQYIYKTSERASYYAQAVGQHQWFTAASGTAGNTISFTQAMTLDASGNLGVGTTSPTFAAGSGLEIQRESATATLRLDRGTSGDSGLEIRAESSQTAVWTTSNTPMLFGTNNTERARITSGGAWVVGDTSAYAVAIALAKSTSAGTSVYNSWNSDTSGTRFHFEFRDGAGATSRGNITTDGANTAYNTSSDRRLKENIAPAAEAGAVIDAIEVVEFDWKSGPHTRYGMIAQDLHIVAPEAVTAGDDGEEIEKSWSVDYSKLVPMLVKEIQSLRARVAQLENK